MKNVHILTLQRNIFHSHFTIFFDNKQGITIKPLVNLLEIKKQDVTKPTMNEKIYERVSANDFLANFCNTYISQILFIGTTSKISTVSQFLIISMVCKKF